MSQESSKKRHGDDKAMVNARRDFLSAGYYAPLRDKVTQIIKNFAFDGCVICDIGCGECYYTEDADSALTRAGIKHTVCGIDISKNALINAHKRAPSVILCASSAYTLPVASGSTDILMNLFAPYCEKEFERITRKGSLMIRVFPGPLHLWELKCAVYDKPYENVIDTLDFPGFELTDKTELSYDISLPDNKTVLDLFSMTPYCYKTSAADRAKLDSVSSLETKVRFTVAVYKKL